MNKYDFGYEIQKGSTTEWAYNIVGNNAEVLELGPAIGTLAKHLKEEKQCQIDIVEIDAEAGKLAKTFARHACIGEAQGDIEGDEWLKTFKDNHYDYIVLLDVIEHLKKPEKLLTRLNNLLKKDGQLLISTPNIAHNSVIINLINNRFEYTNVGILDNTHLKFFTYYSFCELIHSTGYVISKKNYIQERVGENEISCSYNDVSREVETYLRERDLADVYQFTFVLKKEGKEDNSDFPQSLPYTGFKFETYCNGRLYSQKFFYGSDLEEDIVLGDVRDCNFRVDPIDTNAIITDISIFDVEKNCPVKIKAMNGGEIDSNKIAFFDEDPQIIIDTTDLGAIIKFRCHFEVINNEAINIFQPLWREVLERRNQVFTMQKEFQQLSDLKEKLSLENDENRLYINQLEKQIEDIENTSL